MIEPIAKQEYLGLGNLSDYSFDFKITDLNHLLLIRVDTTGAEVFRVHGGDTVYLTGVDFDATEGGGTVHLVDDLPIDHRLILLLANDDPQQPSEFKSKFDFTLSRIEAAIDYVAGALVRASYLAKRSFKLSDLMDPEDFDVTYPSTLTANPDATIVINATGDGLAIGPTGTQIAAAQGYAVAAAASAADALVSEGNAATSEANASTSEGNAATSETNAAASAAAASATLASAVWNDVVFKTFADSPVTIVDGDRGKLFAFDATGGNIQVNLPQIVGLTLTDPWTLGTKKTDNTVNTITFNAFAGDDIEGSPSETLTDADQSKVFIPDTDPAPDSWSVLDSGPSQSTQSRGFHQAIGTGNGVLNTFGPLAHTPLNNQDSLLVYVDGTIHDKSLWSFSGGNVVFTTPPAAGQKIYCSYMYTAIAVTASQQIEYRTVSGGEAAAKALTLTNTPVSPSLVMLDIIGGTSQEYAVDFTVAGTTVDWTGLGLDGFVPAGTKFRLHYWA